MTYCLHCGEPIENFYGDYRHTATESSGCHDDGSPAFLPESFAERAPSKHFEEGRSWAEVWRAGMLLSHAQPEWKVEAGRQYLTFLRFAQTPGFDQEEAA